MAYCNQILPPVVLANAARAVLRSHIEHVIPEKARLKEGKKMSDYNIIARRMLVIRNQLRSQSPQLIHFSDPEASSRDGDFILLHGTLGALFFGRIAWGHEK